MPAGYRHRVDQPLGKGTLRKAFLLPAVRAVAARLDLLDAGATEQLPAVVAVVRVYSQVQANCACELFDVRS